MVMKAIPAAKTKRSAELSRFRLWHVVSVSSCSVAVTPRHWRASGARSWTSSCSIAKRTAAVEIGPRDGFGGPQPTIILSQRDEPEQGKSRLHIDVNATDRDQNAELERLLQLGARPADVGQTGEEPWHVLADPEGNEFCLLKARLKPL